MRHSHQTVTVTVDVPAPATDPGRGDRPLVADAGWKECGSEEVVRRQDREAGMTATVANMVPRCWEVVRLDTDV